MPSSRYAIQGMVLDAAEGKHVVCVIHRAVVAPTIRSLENYAGDHVSKIRRVSGEECVEFASGGRVTFAATASALRGRTADVVYLGNPDKRLDSSICEQAAAVAPDVVFCF